MMISQIFFPNCESVVIALSLSSLSLQSALFRNKVCRLVSRAALIALGIVLSTLKTL